MGTFKEGQAVLFVIQHHHGLADGVQRDGVIEGALLIAAAAKHTQQMALLVVHEDAAPGAVQRIEQLIVMDGQVHKAGILELAQVERRFQVAVICRLPHHIAGVADEHIVAQGVQLADLAVGVVALVGAGVDEIVPVDVKGGILHRHIAGHAADLLLGEQLLPHVVHQEIHGDDHIVRTVEAQEVAPAVVHHRTQIHALGQHKHGAKLVGDHLVGLVNRIFLQQIGLGAAVFADKAIVPIQHDHAAFIRQTDIQQSGLVYEDARGVLQFDAASFALIGGDFPQQLIIRIQHHNAVVSGIRNVDQLLLPDEHVRRVL